jgi:RHS repeat-associated protein
LGCLRLTYESEFAPTEKPVLKVLTTKKSVKNGRSYHSFGTTSYQATNGSITAAAKRYRFTGMERDDETGLNYHNARYYIPWLGRWLNPDPIGIGDGVNVYSYCKNNPVTYKDTSGTQTTGDPNLLRAAGTSSGGTAQYTPPQPPKEPLQASSSTAPLAAAGGNINPAAVTKATQQTQQMATAAGTQKAFIELGRIEAPTPAKESNTGTKVGGVAKFIGGVAEMIGSLALAGTGVGFVLAAAAFAHGFDSAVAGIKQGNSGKETQSGSERMASRVLQAGGFDKADADFGSSLINAGVSGLVGGGGLFGKAGNIERGLSSNGQKYAASVTEGGTGRAFAGHGEIRFGAGTTTIPEGTSLTMWGKQGEGILDKVGKLVETGKYNEVGFVEGAVTHLPGAQVPNLTLTAPTKLNIMSNSMTVEDATKLSDLLKPGMGKIDWAACQLYNY